MIGERKKWNIILLLALGLYSGIAHGQFMRIILDVKKNVGTEQIIPFSIDTLTGPFNIEQVAGTETLYAFGMFSIAAGENITVMVRLEASDIMIDGQNNTRPFDLTMAWQNNGTKNEATAKRAKDNKSVFPLSNSGLLIENMKGAPAILHAYIFLRGTAMVPKTATSPYEGKVHLIVEYE
jgi:hypothetical protein